MKSERPHPAATPQAEADRQARLAREADALRANLRRRKEQSRAREAAAGRGDDDAGTAELSTSVPGGDNLYRF
jgi:hypothetical protein